VFKGAGCLPPEDTRCLVPVERRQGRGDDPRVRHHDQGLRRGGFVLPEGKQNVSWLDKDTLLVAREWEPGQVTKSGYAYVVKALKRGQALADAKEVFRGTPDDVSASAYGDRRRRPGRGGAGLSRRQLLRERDLPADRPREPVKLPFPLKHSIQGYVGGQMVLSLEQDWAEKGFKTGDLISLDLATLKADPAKAPATLVLRPTAKQSVER
jgi:prolyl oligopeptidase